MCRLIVDVEVAGRRPNTDQSPAVSPPQSRKREAVNKTEQNVNTKEEEQKERGEEKQIKEMLLEIKNRKQKKNKTKAT